MTFMKTATGNFARPFFGLATLAITIVSMPALAGFAEGEAALKSKNYAEALSEFQQEAERGNADAQERLAYMYRRGRGVEKDKAIAEDYYRQAAMQGHLKAQLELGKLLYTKRGVSSRSLSTGSAVGGDGYRYDVKGNDEAKAEAYMWINLAAANSGTFSMPEAKVMREDMRDTLEPPTIFKGERRLQQHINNLEIMALNDQADSGDVLAQYALGERYAAGDGVYRSPRIAYHWLAMAYGNGIESARRPRNKQCSLARKTHDYPSSIGFDYLLIEYFETHSEAFVNTSIRAMLNDVCTR